MKKLKDFTGDKAFEVVSNLMGHIVDILRVEENRNIEKATRFEMIQTFLSNSPESMRCVFAILSEADVDEFKPSAADIIKYSVELISDDDFISLFC